MTHEETVEQVAGILEKASSLGWEPKSEIEEKDEDFPDPPYTLDGASLGDIVRIPSDGSPIVGMVVEKNYSRLVESTLTVLGPSGMAYRVPESAVPTLQHLFYEAI